MTTTPPGPDFAGQLLQAFFAQGRAECIIGLDSQGLVRAWSGASEELLGWSPGEMLGEPLLKIFTPEDREKKIHAYELDVARADGYAEDDRWHLRKDGSRIWVTGTLSAVRAADDSIMGFVKVLRDRTDLRTKLERIEQEVIALKAELDRTQHFLHTLGHELRNPLAPLSMAVQLLSLQEASPTGSNALKVIKRQIALIKGLADDLMELARSSHSGFEIASARVHIQELLLNVVSDLRPDATAKGIDLVAVMQDGPVWIEADARRLTQVVLNLLGNALKYTPRGGKVFVKAVEEVNELVIRIEDTGIGVDASMLSRIFDFFTQEADAKMVAPGGLGVGLGLVRQIVELHHGTVAARSAGRDKGSEFTVRLPLVQPVPVPLPRQQS